MQCFDQISGERFEIDGNDPEQEIEQYIADGIDADSGAVDYDVTTECGKNFSGTAYPSDDE